jgi:SAM-dependent methyltransferase
MSLAEVQQFIFRQSLATGSLTALAAILEAKATGTQLDPTLAAVAQGLLEQVGAGGYADSLSPQEASMSAAMIRAIYLMDAKMLSASTRAKTWSHPEPEILNAIGNAARTHAASFTRALVPLCDGLAERLSAPTARLLDVGVGVAGTACALAQMWPELKIVGIDVWQPSLRLARENIDNAGLANRIEIREQSVDAFDEKNNYDACYFPVHFIPERFARPGLARILAALRPGGWIATGATPFEDMPPPVAALHRLRETQWGSPLWTIDQTEQALRDAGFVDLRRAPPQPGPPVIWIVGRKPTA